MVREIKNQILSFQLIWILLTTGCATYTQPVNDTFVMFDETSQITGGLIGPNNVSGSITEGMNYYRNGLAILNNPWNGWFMLRNLWIP